nr:hypothetical protein [Cressdnaviricota sp.]
MVRTKSFPVHRGTKGTSERVRLHYWLNGSPSKSHSTRYNRDYIPYGKYFGIQSGPSKKGSKGVYDMWRRSRLNPSKPWPEFKLMKSKPIKHGFISHKVPVLPFKPFPIFDKSLVNNGFRKPIRRIPNTYKRFTTWSGVRGNGSKPPPSSSLYPIFRPGYKAKFGTTKRTVKKKK